MSTNAVRAGNVNVLQSYDTKIYLADPISDSTLTNAALNSVTVDNGVGTLTVETALSGLAKGNLIYVDSGVYKGYYLVSSVSDKVIKTDRCNTFLTYTKGATYSTTKPKVYKCTLTNTSGLFKTAQYPKSSREEQEVTVFSDRTAQFIGGSVAYDDISFDSFFDPLHPVCQRFKNDFLSGNVTEYALLYYIERTKTLELFVVMLSEFGAVKLESKSLLETTYTFKVQDGFRTIDQLTAFAE